MKDAIAVLQTRYDTSDAVWFFVKPNYRIIHFNKKAASNSVALHNKKIAPGDSILDYARDTSNKIDEEFITCFGKAAAGQFVEHEQQIHYQDLVLLTRSTYTPVYEAETILGISIVVEVTPVKTSET